MNKTVLILKTELFFKLCSFINKIHNIGTRKKKKKFDHYYL